MKILVLSDSHRDYISCEAAIRKHPEVSYIIHLGDGEEDLDRIYDTIGSKPIIRVKGNCSLYSSTIAEQLNIILDGVKIYICHGHAENVKTSLTRLVSRAFAENCNLALYGHTHIQSHEYYEYENLHVFNPGSIRGGCYGIIDISNGKITCEKKML